MRLGRDTFHETWIEGHRMPYTPGDVATFLDTALSRQAIDAVLRDPEQAMWIVERGGEPVGYAKAGPCTLPYPDIRPDDGELKQLYLRRAFQGGALGGALLDTVLCWLDRAGPRRIWLGVWSGNLAAQRFYARRGFSKVGDHTFTVGATVDHEFAMRRG